MKRYIIATAALAAIIATGCRTRAPSMSPPAINATLSVSNRVGSAISDGNQISAMMDKDAVLAAYKEVAMTAAKAGTEMSLTAIGHGAAKQPNVQRESKAAEKLTNSLASAIKAAKSGGNDPQALAKFGADLVGGLVELSEEAANPPAADDTSLLGFDLKVGPGANLAGIAVAKTMSDTRIETAKAARSTYSRINTIETNESNTPAGIDAITAAMVELQKLQNSPAPVAPPATVAPGNPQGDDPTPAVPPSSGAVGAGDLSPQARLEAWYPSALKTDKPGFKPDESGLWKPGVGAAENMRTSNGKLAIHTPHSKLGRVIKIVVDDEASNVGQTGNGGRPLFRFSKTGGAYSGKVTLITDKGTWTATAANPAARCSLDFKLATPASALPPATPIPSTGGAAAPGESRAP